MATLARGGALVVGCRYPMDSAFDTKPIRPHSAKFREWGSKERPNAEHDVPNQRHVASLELTNSLTTGAAVDVSVCGGVDVVT